MSFKDYPYDAESDVHGGVRPALNRGPVKRPVVPPEFKGDCCEDILRAIQSKDGSQSIGGIAERFVEFWRDAFPSGDAIKSFLTGSGAPQTAGPVVTGTTAPLKVVSTLVNEGYYAILQNFELEVEPPAAIQDLTVQIRVSGEIQAKFSANALNAGLLKKLIPFYLKVQPGRSIELWVINTGTGTNILVTGALQGYMRPLK